MTRKSLIVIAILLVALSVVLAGCTQGAATPTATAKPATTGTQAPAGSTPVGKVVFDRNCNSCHPNGAQGVGPSLTTSKLTADQIKTQVRNGKGQMPAFPAATISDADLNELAPYVKSLQR